ncbi:hypothetical protein Y032_0002g1146 [Ancylostoma ceylanicum]|uniref:Uncharacterized protein n=1 Tax=Ancylostoma ceylanicum TaxID=53326 RepID=A0A016VZP8_9BILA|nr:hypothetical protein Y032_0002g1146 [Ancylostoma ceylanicum]
MVILIQCCSFAAISLDLCLSVSASSPSLHYFARLVPSQSAAYGSEVCLGPVSQFTFGQVELGNFYPSSLKNFQLRRTSRMTVISCETPYVIDIRLPPTTNFKEMDELIDSWCKKAGPGVTYKFLVKTEIPVMTPTTSDDPFWAAFEKSLQDEGYKTVCRTGGVAFGSCRKMGVAYLNIRNEHDETHCSKIKS